MTDIQAIATPTGSVPAELVDFVVHEARLADENRYAEWESLWADDGVYWIPTGDHKDPQTQVSFVFDNRHRIGSRIAQLLSGRRHSQTPPSKMRRQLTNFEVLSDEGGEVELAANFSLFEHRYTTTVWAGRYLYRLRHTADGLSLVKKTVLLINNESAIRTIAFIL